jgi:hypothetical protein
MLKCSVIECTLENVILYVPKSVGTLQVLLDALYKFCV